MFHDNFFSLDNNVDHACVKSLLRFTFLNKHDPGHNIR